MLERLGGLSPQAQRIVLLIGCALCFFVWFVRVPLTEADETRFTEATREMIESGNYIIPSFNYVPRYRKPILYYWLQAGSVALFGQDESAARIPSALATTILVLMVHSLLLSQLAGRAAKEDQETQRAARGAAFLGSAALITMPMVAVWARAAVTDATLTMWVTATLISLLKADLADEKRAIRKWYILAGLFAGLAFLTKGPVGLAIPGLVWLVYHAYQRDLRDAARSVPWLSAVGIFLLVAAPWYVATYIVDGPAFMQRFFLTENLGRYTNTMEGHGASSRMLGLLTYLPIALIFAFPYSIFVLHEFVLPFGGSPKLAERDNFARMRRFAAVWLAVVIGIFALSRTQLPSYIQSIGGAVSILFALHLLGRFGSPEEPVGKRWARGMETGLLLLFGLVWTALPIVALSKGFARGPLGKTPYPQTQSVVLMVLFAVCMVLLTAGTLVSAFGGRRRGTGWVLAPWTLCFGALVFGFLPIFVQTTYKPSVVVGEFLRGLPRGEQVISYCKDNSESMVYYARRRVEFHRQDERGFSKVLREAQRKDGSAIVVTDDDGIAEISKIGRFDRLKRFQEIEVVSIMARSGDSTPAQSKTPPKRCFENFGLNISLFRLVNSNHNPALDRVFLVVWLAGSGYVLLLVLPLTYWLRRAKVKVVLLAVAIETIAVAILKDIFVQPRPASLLPDVHLLRDLHAQSFPSGDVAMAFAVAFVLLSGEKCWVKVGLTAYGILIAYERLYLGVHFPLDVTAGAVVGIVSARTAYAILKSPKRVISRKGGSP